MRSGDSIPGSAGDCCGGYAECHHRTNHPGAQSPETQKPARGGFSEECVGRGGGIRTPNHRFWRPLFYQLELRPCIQRGELYKLTLKGKDLFLPFTRKCAINKRKVTKHPFCRRIAYFLTSSINMHHGLLYNHSRSDSRMGNMMAQTNDCHLISGTMTHGSHPVLISSDPMKQPRMQGLFSVRTTDT